MADHDVLFPDAISYGSASHPSYKTLVVELPSGVEERVSRRAVPRHRFDISYNGRDADEIAELRKFIILRNGSAHSFRIRDFLDFCTSSALRPASFMDGVDPSPTDQYLGDGTGALASYQLVRRYSDGSSPNVVRTIEKPRSGTVRVAFDGVEQTEGVSWSLDYATGVLLATAPLGEAVTWGGEYDCHVRFDTSAEEFLSQTVVDFDNVNVGSVGMVEVLSEAGVLDDFFYGGGSEFEIGGSASISLQHGRVQVFKLTNAGQDLFLPDSSVLPLGSPFLYIRCDPTGNGFEVRDISNALIATMTPGDIFEFGVWPDGSGGRTWLAK